MWCGFVTVTVAVTVTDTVLQKKTWREPVFPPITYQASRKFLMQWTSLEERQRDRERREVCPGEDGIGQDGTGGQGD
ncbi:hypothetical protein CORC01_12359 [Colletotrichum orchidophilum]|uniref:Uncharacterized protein n=1 Tax=Colletotrichum orchidophilum TaxID=1209926 RepID=A0A1G4AT79_9PEZI|nr:uncharacterized protein CORC01_12359 [Colletotrichum orchidophilum]OHE92364.1 hypothetical protein CORC01_12359 [Colletotrichum orchidophilum]